jgi:hypothetical protein
MHKYQAKEFLSDGYNLWKGEPTTSYPNRVLFLRDLFDTLEKDPAPRCPDDMYSVPEAVAAPAVAYFGAIAWTGAKIIDEAFSENDEETLAAYSRRFYTAVASMNPDLVPPKSISVAKRVAERFGWPDPFPNLHF